MNKWALSIISIFSCGWIIPLYLAYDSYLKKELPLILMGQHYIHRFPYWLFSRQAFLVACVWLGITIILWSILLLRKRQ